MKIITGFFKRAKDYFVIKFSQSKAPPTFYLSDYSPLFHRYEVFYKIIDKHLESRTPDNVLESVFIYSKDDGTDVIDFKYLAKMYDDLIYNFEGYITRKTLYRMDNRCMGHVDYVHKFAYKIAEYEYDTNRY